MKSMKVSSLVLLIFLTFTLLFVPSAHASTTSGAAEGNVSILNQTVSQDANTIRENYKMSDNTSVVFQYDKQQQKVYVFRNGELKQTFTVNQLRTLAQQAQSSPTIGATPPSPALDDSIPFFERRFPDKFDRNWRPSNGNACGYIWATLGVVNSLLWGAAGFLSAGVAFGAGAVTGTIISYAGVAVC